MTSSLVKRRHRATALLDSLLFVGVALAVIAGGVALYDRVRMSLQVMEQSRILNWMIGEVLTMTRHRLRGGMEGYVNANALVAAGALPPGVVSDAAGPHGSFVRTVWGGEMDLQLETDPHTPDVNAVITLYDIPVAACAGLVPVDMAGNAGFADGLVRITVGSPRAAGSHHARRPGVTALPGYANLSFPIGPAEATAICKAADAGPGGTVAELRFLIRPFG